MTHDTALSARLPLESFIAKLDRRAMLPDEVRGDLLALPFTTHRAKPLDVIFEEGDESRNCLFVDSGVVTRRMKYGKASRIVGLGLSGDAVDLQSLWFAHNDHSIVAQTDASLVCIQHDDIRSLCERHARLAKVLWHDSLVDSAIFREWTLNIAHRRAERRIAAFLLELLERQQAVGALRDDAIVTLPLTQKELGSALGLSLVHVNKSIRALRDARMLEFLQPYHSGVGIRFPDRRQLAKWVNFDPSYLRLHEAPRFNCS